MNTAATLRARTLPRDHHRPRWCAVLLALAILPGLAAAMPGRAASDAAPAGTMAAGTMTGDGTVNLPTVARDDAGRWRVESLGRGVYLFRWTEGAYVSVFVVGEHDVLATDPINRRAAAAYRLAVARITPLPITQVVYSHDHRDHIVGADVLAPHARIVAHRNTLAHIRARRDPDIVPPTRLVGDGAVLHAGTRSVRVHYFGPNHSDSNLALGFDTDHGTLLQFVDTLEIGIVPYRTLPDTHLRGYLRTLRAASRLHADLVLGGHSGPGPGIWVDNYLAYLGDMETSCRRAMTAPAGAAAGIATSVDAIIDDGEAHTAQVIDAVMNDLRPRYGAWAGFEAWAPLNIQAMMSFLTIGN